VLIKVLVRKSLTSRPPGEQMVLLRIQVLFQPFSTLCHSLRSTKWNATLIFTCGFQELGTLRKVLCWKIHIPVRTPKWLPRLVFCRGMSRPENWYRDYLIKACDTCDMTCEHVSRQGKLWSFFPCALDLSVSVGFYTASFSADFKQYLTGYRLSYPLGLKL